MYTRKLVNIWYSKVLNQTRLFRTYHLVAADDNLSENTNKTTNKRLLELLFMLMLIQQGTDVLFTVNVPYISCTVNNEFMRNLPSYPCLYSRRYVEGNFLFKTHSCYFFPLYFFLFYFSLPFQVFLLEIKNYIFYRSSFCIVFKGEEPSVWGG